MSAGERTVGLAVADQIVFMEYMSREADEPALCEAVLATLNAHAALLSEREALTKRIAELESALKEGRRAIGDHWAPNDCYATGPVTGDPIRDLVQCPACSFIAEYDAALALAQPVKP